MIAAQDESDQAVVFTFHEQCLNSLLWLNRELVADLFDALPEIDSKL